VKVLLDYRPALRERSGVGEYAHRIACGLIAASREGGRRLDLTLFSSSWKDRIRRSAELDDTAAIDRRIPGRLLNLAWHRMEWPTVETLTHQSFDIAHSLHPLLMPARDAAQVVTIHDFSFLDNPERTRAEVRRDYPLLARCHARRAHAIVTISHSTAREIERRFDIPAGRIAVCPPGAPPWEPRASTPADGYILFVGTLEPRKNLPGLLDAYEQLLARRRDLPRLVVAGKALPESSAWLARLARAPLAGHVEHVGYVEPDNRQALYQGARLLVQSSFDEGFGMPVLEAMTLGVPVVASARGALPEVVDDAGPLVDPDEPATIAAAIERMIDDDAFASACVAKGLARSRHYSWDAAVRGVYEAYERAIERRCASA
jgi:glycosyltransferase involved in cell wall biosynthesis